MNKLIVILLVLSGCAVPPGVPNSNNCGMILAGSLQVKQNGMFQSSPNGTISYQDLESRLNAALSSIDFVTDPQIFDRIEQCQKLVGYRVYTNPNDGFYIPQKKVQLAGANWCHNKTILIATPTNRDWRQSSLVHEIYHAFQSCNSGSDEPDRIKDTDHRNWVRYGIYNAIEIARDL